MPFFNFRVLDDQFFCRSGIEVIGDLGFERWLVALEREQVVSLVLNDLIGDGDLTAHGVDSHQRSFELFGFGQVVEKFRNGRDFIGFLGTPRFDAALDVPNGGVLLALPSLLVSGLLHHAQKMFRFPAGFYGLQSIFLLLAFMALGRLRSVEALRYHSPGEWGKLVGLDRVPEVRTLRIKLKHLADQERAFEWSAELCRQWMTEAPEEAAILYVDGHVRVYHGRTKKLPKHYVARERLCLSATADYWVNSMEGKPFFVVSQAVNPGILQTLADDIVPRLEQDVPNQPTAAELEADPLLHRFTVAAPLTRSALEA